MPILLLLAVRAQAATLTVCASGCDATDLASAVAAAQAGDTIEVGEGTWTDSVQITRDVTIVAGDPTLTFLDPGGGTLFTVDDGARFTLRGFRVAEGSGHLVAVYRAAEATVEELLVEGFTAEVESGAPHGPFETIGGGTLTIRDSEFFDLRAPNGMGLVHGYDGDVTLERVTVDGSVSDHSTVEASEGSLTITGSAFTGCDAAWYSPVYAAVAVIDGSVFTANSSGSWGGGHLDVHDLTLRDSTLTDGIGEHFGGAATASERAVIERTIFARNTARIGSGALNCGGPCSIVDATFEENDGGYDYGGAAEIDAGATILRTTFRDNRADGPGGALSFRYADTDDVTITDSTFIGNESGQAGGAAYFDQSRNVAVIGSFFDDNTAAVEGGAIALAGNAAVDVSDSTFYRNWAGGGGGAIATNNPLTVRRTILCDNTAQDGHGGAIAGTAATIDVRASVLAGNTSPVGGALHADGGGVTVQNADFLWNDAADGAAIQVSAAPLEIVNALFGWNLTGPVVSGASLTSATTAYNATWQDASAPSGLDLGVVVTSDPLLGGIPAPGFCEDLDPSRLAGSPLLDAGDPAVLDGDGSRSDIGAFGGPDTWADSDGDGWLSLHDCDDEDALVSPGADERCNGVDDDCDDAVDEEPVDVATWAPDSDGDGYGAGEAVVACTPPEGYVALLGDCDDADDRRHPGADEIANDAIDQDCDDEDLEAWLTGRTCATGPVAGTPLWIAAGLLLRRRRARGR